MTPVVLVALGAAVGAPARWWVDRRVTDALAARRGGRARAGRGALDEVPWGTTTVNLVGSLVLGIVLGLAGRIDHGRDLSLVAGTGFCGAFTTFSTFAVEVVRLAERGRPLAAVTTVVVGIVPGVLLAALGWWLAASR